MIIVIKNGSEKKEVDRLVEKINSMGLVVNELCGFGATALSVIGDTSAIDVDLINSSAVVDKLYRIQDPYRIAGRNFHPQDTVIDVDGVKFGGDNFQIIAGPCSVESEEQIIRIAKAVKAAGATVLRGGAYKPRSSPYAFQGLKEEGISFLLSAKNEVGLPVITEIVSVNHLELFKDVDIIQVGARNMQNYELLRELGRSDKPVLLKRSMAATIEEWLMSAEYIMSEGNKNVILCERGIRTFEPSTRCTLDLSAVPLVKGKTHLPVFVDPSHAAGKTELVGPMALASVGAGADGIMVEVHDDPLCSLCDGAQALLPEDFDSVVEKIKAMLPVVGKSIQ